MDKTNKKNIKVVVGMTGRRDSTVAAYLLKKQGYDCIGLSLLLNDEQLPKLAQATYDKKAAEAEEFNLNDSYSDPRKIPKDPLYSRCHVSDIEKVKEICDHLEIPFYGVKAQEVFKSGVMDNMVASRLGGSSFQSCINCNQVKLSVLMEKAEALGADYIATGHYSKIIKNQTTGFMNVARGNDADNDQSYLLSRVNQEILQKLMLPLAEMRVEEVDKLLKLVDIKCLPSTEGTKMCYGSDPRVPILVEYLAADTLLSSGHFSIASEDTIMADHKGVHNFYLGQSKLKLASEKNIDPDLHVINIKPSSGTVYLASAQELAFTHCHVQRVRYDPELDITKPIELFAKIGSSKEMLPCTVFFKNNRAAIIRFKKAQPGMLSKGLVVALFNKRAIGAKLVMSGFILESGILEQGKIKTYIAPEVVPLDDEEAEQREKEKRANALPDYHF
jgi:tRNA-specific 2-thiouridylase